MWVGGGAGGKAISHYGLCISGLSCKMGCAKRTAQLEVIVKSKVNPQLLDDIREAHGFKNDLELADFLGLAPSTLSGIRNGTNPRLATAIVIFDAAGVTDLRHAVIRPEKNRAA